MLFIVLRDYLHYFVIAQFSLFCLFFSDWLKDWHLYNLMTSLHLKHFVYSLFEIFLLCPKKLHCNEVDMTDDFEFNFTKVQNLELSPGNHHHKSNLGSKSTMLARKYMLTLALKFKYICLKVLSNLIFFGQKFDFLNSVI